jgi:hypothetical protein
VNPLPNHAALKSMTRTVSARAAGPVRENFPS